MNVQQPKDKIDFLLDNGYITLEDNVVCIYHAHEPINIITVAAPKIITKEEIKNLEKGYIAFGEGE